MQCRRVKVFACVALFFGSGAQLLAGSVSDTIEQKIQSAIDDERVVHHLGAAFSRSPCGEFLLAPGKGDLRFGILIYNIDIHPDRAVFSAGMAFRDPRSHQLTGFVAQQVPFSYKNGLSGDVTLVLMDSMGFRLGKNAEVCFYPGADGTSALMDCRGFREFSVRGHAEFRQDFFVPVNEKGDAMPGEKLRADFAFRSVKWSDMLLEISLPPFSFKETGDIIFSAEKMILDLSETFNHAVFQWPEMYELMGVDPLEASVWEGFYMEKGRVLLPKTFADKNGRRPVLEFADLLIDHRGFTGKIHVRNIIPFSAGILGGWQFSMEEFTLELCMNRLRNLGFSGRLGLPVLPDTSSLAYRARLSGQGHYLLSVSTPGVVSFPALKAVSVQLDSQSFVLAEIRDGSVKLEACLSGRMKLASAEERERGIPAIHFPSIAFMGMRISNQNPEFGIDYLGIHRGADSGRLAGFPVQLNSITLLNQGSHYLLTAGLYLNVTEYATARTTLQIRCRMEEIHGRKRLVFDQMIPSSADVRFEKSGILIAGSISLFRGDPDYGSGFRGEVRAEIREPSVKVSALALFGNINQFRYWYFDASAEWPAPGFMLFPGVNMNGFAGGAWHRLKPWNGGKKPEHPEYGQTASGIILIPDATAGLGLKAGVFLNGGTEKSYQAYTVLEMHFHRTGSLQRTLFYGDIEVLPSNTRTGKKDMGKAVTSVPLMGTAWDRYRSQYDPKAEICGPFMLDLDHRKHVYSANASVYFKQAAGNTINGMHRQFLAGNLSAGFSADQWHLSLGIPNEPLGVKLSVGGLSGLSASAYYLAGTELPAPAAPPAEIAHFFGTDIFSRNETQGAVRSGKGFVVGTAFAAEASAGGTDRKVSIYAVLKAKAANEVSFIRYDKGTYCEGSGQVPGKNGWYSTGTVYAYLQGKLGARSGRFRIDVMTFTGAMAMQYGGPNPYYAKGRTHLSFDVGGVFRYDGNMDVVLGSPCSIASGNSETPRLVRSTLPADGSRETDPFLKPEVEFNLPVGRAFRSGDGRNLIFRIRECNITHPGGTVAGHLTLNPEGTKAIFSPAAVLPGQTSFRWQILLDLAEIRDRDTISLSQNGAEISETVIVLFQTAAALNVIPVLNVKSAYPAPGQQVYSGEKTGFVQLKQAQDELLYAPGKKIIVRISSVNSLATYETQGKYLNGKIIFTLPDSVTRLVKYKLRIIRVPENYTLNNGTKQDQLHPTSESLNQRYNTADMNSFEDKNTRKSDEINQELLLEYEFVWMQDSAPQKNVPKNQKIISKSSNIPVTGKTTNGGVNAGSRMNTGSAKQVKIKSVF